MEELGETFGAFRFRTPLMILKMISYLLKEKEFFLGGLLPMAAIVGVLIFLPVNSWGTISFSMCLFTAGIFFTVYVSLSGQAMIQQFSIYLNFSNFKLLQAINMKINSKMKDKELLKFNEVEKTLREIIAKNEELVVKGTEKNDTIRSKSYVALMLACMYLGFGIAFLTRHAILAQ